jgi:hypothetical protein
LKSLCLIYIYIYVYLSPLLSSTVSNGLQSFQGLVYGFVGGMTCASARRIYGEVNGSPQGAFILIGDFPAGRGLLVVMLLGTTPHIVVFLGLPSFLGLLGLPSFLVSLLSWSLFFLGLSSFLVSLLSWSPSFLVPFIVFSFVNFIYSIDVLHCMEVVGRFHFPGCRCNFQAFQKLFCLSSLTLHLWMCVRGLQLLYY